MSESSPHHRFSSTWRARFAVWSEIGLIFTLFFVLGGTPPPDENEAHYLAKAKHYWDPSWCPGDAFLDSADAHLVFYWTIGWLTRFCSLSTTAWIGRLVTWGLLAWSWSRLSRAIVPGRLVALLSAAVFAALMRWGHMAGEWVIGGVEAKGFSYVCVFLALEALVHERWCRAILLCGAATAFHVLVGGWALVAVGIAWWLSDRRDRPIIFMLLPSTAVAIGLAMPGVLPGLALTWSADSETLRYANHIYVFERLSHHLVFHKFSHAFIARHVALAVAWWCIWCWGKDWHRGDLGSAALVGPLPRFVAAAALIALAGAILDQSLLYFRPVAASVLRYYWFRLSDVMVPFGMTFALVAVCQRLAPGQPRAHAWALLALIFLATANVAYEALQHRIDPRPGAAIQAAPAENLSTVELERRWKKWLEVCAWAERNTKPNDLFLTPRQQQTFKWYAQRPEIVTGKDVPQDAAGIVAWRKRMDDVFPYTIRFADLVAHGEPRLRELARKYRFRYIIIDRGISTGLLQWPRVYPERTRERGFYEVYRVPPE